MKPQPGKVQAVYLVLVLFSTLAVSFIRGINTLFLLDAGSTRPGRELRRRSTISAGPADRHAPQTGA